MTDENINLVVSLIAGKVHDNNLVNLKNSLKNVPDNKVDRILCARSDLHNPTSIILLSIFFGGLGIDRFAIGDIGFGFAKLLLGWATLGIWPFFDIFISYEKAKEKNYKKLIKIIKE